jgi:hypothetical protein
MAASVFNYPAMQQTADKLVKFFGMGAVLRSITGVRPDRPCTIAVVEYKPRERPNELVNPTDRNVIMSPLDPTTGLPLAIPPDNELDVLVTFVQPLASPPVQDEVLRLTCKPEQTNPAGVNCVWQFTVR